MSSGSMSPAVLGVVAVVVLAAGALFVVGGLGFTSTSVSVSDGDWARVPDDSDAGPIVISTHEVPPSLSIFGLRFGSTRYIVHVGFFPPPGCEPDEDGRLEPEGPCAGIPVAGEVSGGGTLPNGDSFVLVGVRVSGDCYATVSAGDPWPSPHPSCSSDASR